MFGNFYSGDPMTTIDSEGLVKRVSTQVERRFVKNKSDVQKAIYSICALLKGSDLSISTKRTVIKPP